MMPYSKGIILDNANQYGIVKTKTVLRSKPAHENFANSDINTTEPLEWIYSEDKYATLKAKGFSRSLKRTSIATSHPSESRNKKVTKQLRKKSKKQKGKLKRCIMKLLKIGNKNKHKKYIVPLILGLLAAKSLLISVAIKALVFISVKGLLMGFFSTVLASVFSLKGMLERSHAWNRREDAKTQVEIIQVPSKSDENVYYDHYKRSDRIPF